MWSPELAQGHPYRDRVPRNDRDFWSYFHYIHVNPINRDYVRAMDGAVWVEGDEGPEPARAVAAG